MLTNEQIYIINQAINWYRNSSEQTFQYTGSAGCGKTFLMFHILKALNLNIEEVAPMAYTGAASLVMRKKGFYNARTIHSWLFDPVEKVKIDIKGNPIRDPYFDVNVYELKFVPKPLTGIKLIIVDEASMVPMDLKKEIDSRGIKVIACGDLQQLPPVTSNPGYLVSGKIYRLTQIMRQAEGSPIVYLAQRASKNLPIHKGNYYGALVIGSDELNSQMLASTEILLSGKNKTREFYNNLIRKIKMGVDNENTVPVFGDILICRKNNWNICENGINLVNGLIGTVINYPDVTGYQNRMFRLDFLPNMSSVPFMNIKCDYEYFVANYEKRNILKNAKYFKGEKFEYAYAITTHLSQGSQFKNGIYVEEFLNRNINNKLNYTGITRFADFMIYVKQSKKYF